MIMKKILGFLLLSLALQTNAQEEKKAKPDYKKLDLTKRASDHFMFQFGVAGWGKPDNITTKSFNRSGNVYFLFDFPFKSDPRLSVAVGPGVGTDNIYFEKMTVDLKARTGATFTRDTITKYKKHKLSTAYLEAPLELRFSTKPDNMNSGWKFALGIKVGTLLDAKTKSKVDLDANAAGGYFQKIKDKRYFNSTRFAATARVGYGNFSVFGSLTATDFFKEGFGPDVRPFTVGVVLSGL